MNFSHRQSSAALFTASAGVLLLLISMLSACGGKAKEKTYERALNVYIDPPADMVYSVRYYFQNEHQIQLNIADNHDYSGAASYARIKAERKNPAADVYWAGDAIYCELLRQEGLTIPYRAVSDIPAQFRDPNQTWTGFVGRGRVLLVRRALEGQAKSILDYTKPAMKNRGALADPLHGSTRSHFAALAAVWGDQKLATFYRAAVENGTVITKTMEESAELVARGKRDFALVDSDVALRAMSKAAGVELVYPDQGAGSGLMVIPQAVCILQGTQDAEAARTLADYLTSTIGVSRIVEKEQFLIPFLRSVGSRSPYLWRIEALKLLTFDYAEAARKLQAMDKILGP